MLRQIGGRDRSDREQRWLQAVAARVTAARPDLADELTQVLDAEPAAEDLLNGMTIGEIGVCYEALVSQNGSSERRSAGQYFTPDDAARFMATLGTEFGGGVWLDPCCGVGNLSWHLASLHEDPGSFVRDSLILMDKDDIALRSAIALLAAGFAERGDAESVRRLQERARRGDFLKSKLPDYDYAILNPPYSRAVAPSGYATAQCRDLFAFFLERVAKSSKGYVAVTPASYLSAPKFQPLRTVMSEHSHGGEILVFDNVPDTLFRGYKFGSSNTSKTNFVRAAITACSPEKSEWKISPIIRWKAANRSNMFEECRELLAPRRNGPHGEWAKLSPGQERIWDELGKGETTLHHLVVKGPTAFRLDVALTPRYYISAAFRELDRTTKAVLYFNSYEDRDRAAVVINSSIPYLWWRALDGGVTLPRRVLMSIPIPDLPDADKLVETLKQSEEENVVTKLNAGRQNENVKHPPDLVRRLNSVVMPGAEDIDLLYANNMFPLSR